MVNVKVAVEGGKVYLSAPYEPDFPSAARDAGGRFDRARKAWQFDKSQEQRVRELARCWWGTDGDDEFAHDVVTVKMRVVGRETKSHLGGVELFDLGRKIAHRLGRDTPVILGPDVVLVSGGFEASCGSMKYPGLGPLEDTWVEVLNVPRSIVPENDPDYKIIEQHIDPGELLQEKERLLARVKEIDGIIGLEPDPNE